MSTLLTPFMILVGLEVVLLAAGLTGGILTVRRVRERRAAERTSADFREGYAA